MGYVMVPVPEEHVEEAMHLILRLASRAKEHPWDAESVEELFSSIDEPSRAVLSTVARSVVAKGAVADTAIAETIEFTQREVLAIVRELNEQGRESGHGLLLLVRQETQTLPNGRKREQRMVGMETEVAQLVRAAERAEAQAVGHPLLGDQP